MQSKLSVQYRRERIHVEDREEKKEEGKKAKRGRPPRRKGQPKSKRSRPEPSSGGDKGI